MWDEAQVEIYLGELEACSAWLAANPLLGRACPDVSPGLRRTEPGRHVVFYRERGKAIVIVRVLHQAMMPRRWRIEGDR
jgi:plasmid stabilization system protein ParE